jgi:hypothetical protein
VPAVRTVRKRGADGTGRVLDALLANHLALDLFAFH